MNITTESLTAPKTPDPTPEPKAIKPEAPYTKEEVSKSDSHSELYVVRARRYAESVGFKVVDTIQQAVHLRKEGYKALSIREADTAARTAMPLDNSLVCAVIMQFTGEVCVTLLEDVAGAANSVFELRKYYNKGLAYFKSSKPLTDPPAKVVKDRQRVRKTLAMLEFANAPAWPEEIENGFPLEMCKPDFLTWEAYNKRLVAGGNSNHDFDKFNKEYVYDGGETNEAYAAIDPATGDSA